MKTVPHSSASAPASGATFQDLDGDELNYTEQSGAVLIDQGDAAILETDLTTLAGLVLTVTVEGMTSTQILSLRNQGKLPGQIGIEGGEITYGGIVIGEATGEPGGPLTITLVTNDAAAISALIRNLTYEDTSDAPEADGARILIELSDEGTTLASAAVTLNVTVTEDGPRAVEDSFSLDAGGNIIGNVKDNDYDPDDPDDRSLFDVVSFNAGATYESPAAGGETIDTSVEGAYGTLTLNADGTFTYRADNASSIPTGETREDTFSYAIKDADGALSVTTITFEVTGQPAFAIRNLDGDILDYPEGSSPLLLDTAGAAYVDGTLTSYDGVTLTISIDDVSGSEFFSIRKDGTGPGQIDVSIDGIVSYEGIEIGLLINNQGEAAVVHFNEDASNAALEAVLRRITYQDFSDAPSDKELTITLARGATLFSVSHVTVAAQGADDAPVTYDDGLVVSPGGSQAGSVTRNDYDPDDLDAVLTVTGFYAGSDRSDVATPGTTIQGTYGVLILNANGTYTYLANKADSIPPGRAEQDVFTYEITSSAGGVATGQLVMVVENPIERNLYTFSNLDMDSLLYKEQSGPVLLDRDVSVDSGGLGWHGVKISVDLSGNQPEETLSIRHEGMEDGQVGINGENITFSGTVVGSIQRFSSERFSIEFNAAADDDVVSAVLRNIQYNNSKEIFSSVSRTIILEVTVGGETFGFDGGLFELVPANDPLLPAADQVSVLEEAAISGNVLANDVDPDKPYPLPMTATIRGAVAGVAEPLSRDLAGPISIAGQYGSLILNLDGTFTYEANRSDDLIAGETGTDIFTYSFRNETGDEAFAQLLISVKGSDEIRTGSNAHDVLLGGRGADELNGLGGNDRLTGGQGQDVLKGGKGKDIFVFEAPTSGPDMILDFKVKEDKIHLFGKEFGLRKGKLKPDAFFKLKGKSPRAEERDDRILYDQKKGLLYFDSDGSGKKKAPILIATLKGKPILEAKDFYII